MNKQVLFDFLHIMKTSKKGSKAPQLLEMYDEVTKTVDEITVDNFSDDPGEIVAMKDTFEEGPVPEEARKALLLAAVLHEDGYSLIDAAANATVLYSVVEKGKEYFHKFLESVQAA